MLTTNRTKESWHNEISLEQTRIRRYLLFIIIIFFFTDSDRTKPRAGGVLVLPWHADITKRAACSLARSLCDTAEMGHRPIRCAAGKSCHFSGNTPAYRKPGAARGVWQAAIRLVIPRHTLQDGMERSHSCLLSCFFSFSSYMRHCQQ